MFALTGIHSARRPSAPFNAQVLISYITTNFPQTPSIHGPFFKACSSHFQH